MSTIPPLKLKRFKDIHDKALRGWYGHLSEDVMYLVNKILRLGRELNNCPKCYQRRREDWYDSW